MIFLHTTLKRKDSAERVARSVVTEKIAAHVNYWPVSSVYRHAGEVYENEGYSMVFSTLSSKVPEIEAHINQEEAHTVHMIARIQVDVMNDLYKKWVSDRLRM